jgi:hypothetical protein
MTLSSLDFENKIGNRYQGCKADMINLDCGADHNIDYVVAFTDCPRTTLLDDSWLTRRL